MIGEQSWTFHQLLHKSQIYCKVIGRIKMSQDISNKSLNRPSPKENFPHKLLVLLIYFKEKAKEGNFPNYLMSFRSNHSKRLGPLKGFPTGIFL